MSVVLEFVANNKIHIMIQGSYVANRQNATCAAAYEYLTLGRSHSILFCILSAARRVFVKSDSEERNYRVRFWTLEASTLISGGPKFGTIPIS